MAIPSVSTIAYPSTFIDAKADTVSPLVDYETGGIALQDPSAGLQYQVWTAKTDGSDITIEAANNSPQIIYSGINITEISLAFDANMNYLVAFVEDGQAKFKWYDSTIPGFTVTELWRSTELNITSTQTASISGSNYYITPLGSTDSYLLSVINAEIGDTVIITASARVPDGSGTARVCRLQFQDGANNTLLYLDSGLTNLTAVAQEFSISAVVPEGCIDLRLNSLSQDDPDWEITAYKVEVIKGNQNPRCTLDDKRKFNNDGRSIILAYVRNDKLYARYQNDRYQTEYDLGVIPTAGQKLAKIGMMTNLRLGYVFSNSLYLDNVKSEIFRLNRTLQFSCFLKQLGATSYARLLSISNDNYFISLDYKSDTGLYILFPNNLPLCIITDLDAALIDVNSFLSCNIYNVPDIRVGYEGFEKTIVELYYRNTTTCDDFVIKTAEVYIEQLNNTIFDLLEGNVQVAISGGSVTPNEKPFIIDKLKVSSEVKSLGELKLDLDTLGICGIPSAGNLEVQAPTLLGLGSLALYPENAYSKFYIWSSTGEYKAESFQNNNPVNTDRGTFVVDPNDPDFEPTDYEIYAVNNGGDVPTSGVTLNEWHTIGESFIFWEWLVTVSYQTKTIALLVTLRRKDDISNTVTFQLNGFVTKEN